MRISASRLVAPAFQQDRTSICCLGRKRPLQMIEFVFSASLETIQREPPEENSFAQSATCETWQTALR
jgi:hypothetical protein